MNDDQRMDETQPDQSAPSDSDNFGQTKLIDTDGNEMDSGEAGIEQPEIPTLKSDAIEESEGHPS